MNYPGRDSADIVTPDHYATLQVSRRSEDLVIRAAYLALMRRYHPDTNPSDDAALRTRAINSAYAVLGDPDRRAEYDQMRARAMWFEPPPRRPFAWLPMAAAIAGISALFAIPLLIDWTPRSGIGAIDRLQTTHRRAAATPTANPAALCASRAAYDRIKQDLFRQAAQLRGSDEALFARMAGYAVLRVETPVLAAEQREPDAVSCRAEVALDLPPGVATNDGRQSLRGGIAFSLPDGGAPNALALAEGGELVTELATLARVSPPNAPPTGGPDPIPEPNDVRPQFVPPLAEPVRPRAPPPLAQPLRPRIALPPTVAARAPTAAKASSGLSCRFGAGGGAATCGNADLSRLDRRQTLLYTQSWGSANETKRALLAGTRDGFIARRNACPSDACVSQAYLARMREISDIMVGDWRKLR